MRELLTAVFTWPWFSEPHGYNFNGHFVQYAGGNLCIDPVEATDEDLEDLARQGVTRILLTNRNHSRAANRIRANRRPDGNLPSGRALRAQRRRAAG